MSNEPSLLGGGFLRRIAELKHNEQEVIVMCKPVQDYADKAAAEGVQKSLIDR